MISDLDWFINFVQLPTTEPIVGAPTTPTVFGSGEKE